MEWNKQKSIGLCALIALIIAFWFLFLKKEEFLDYPSSGQNIIAFGDSLVEGAGASPRRDFVSLLSERLGIHIINAGNGGDTTGAALARLQNHVLSHDPKIVILLLGGNDAIRRIPISETFNNLGTIIDRIHAQGAGVLLLGVRGGIFSDKYKKEFLRIAEEKRVSFIPDVLEDIFAHPNLMYDTIHPNDRGHEIIAGRIEPILRMLLQKR